ncbi:MAG: hypothetical protein HC805_02225 [Alkalinema sp. RL_2_19]|nr:hypothetical protein [Alkalinema sp. RL_2_19]
MAKGETAITPGTGNANAPGVKGQPADRVGQSDRPVPRNAENERNCQVRDAPVLFSRLSQWCMAQKKTGGCTDWVITLAVIVSQVALLLKVRKFAKSATDRVFPTGIAL